MYSAISKAKQLSIGTLRMADQIHSDCTRGVS